MRKITIAIDGYSSTGKSTVARQLADYLGYIYVDTGAMYRAVTLYALRKGIAQNDQLDKEALIAALPEIRVAFNYDHNTGTSEVMLNGERVGRQIRTDAATFVKQLVARCAFLHENPFTLIGIPGAFAK